MAADHITTEGAGTPTPAPRRVKGHRLVTESVRGGIIAQCSCGAVYAKPTRSVTFAGREHWQYSAGVWQTWERDRIRAAHQAHLTEVSQSPSTKESK